MGDLDWLDDDLDPWWDDPDPERNAELDAARRLRLALPDACLGPAPEGQIAAAAQRLREARGERAAGLPDRGLVLSALLAPLAPAPGEDWSEDDLAALDGLTPHDWVTAVVALVRSGVGTRADVHALTAAVLAGREGPPVEREARQLAGVFARVLEAWRAAGALDADDRLTELGAWALPTVLLLLWDAAPGARSRPPSASEPSPGTGFWALFEEWRGNRAGWSPDRSRAAVDRVLQGEDASASVQADEYELFLHRLSRDTDGTPRSAVPRLLLARQADEHADTASYVAFVESASAADPLWPPALLAAVELAELRGDAGAALDLLLRLGEPRLENQLWQLRHFSTPPPPAGPGRNSPCRCGSGRKVKLCCTGSSRHPLRARAAWFWTKVRRYLQQSPQLHDLLVLGDRLGETAGGRAADLHRVEALTDPLVLDLGAFEGGLLQRFLDRRGSLLPPDEQEVARSWSGSRRSVYEVTATRAGFGVRLRDLVRDDVVAVDERLSVVGLERRAVVLSRVLETGDGPVLGTRLPVPPDARDGLIGALVAGGEAPLLAWRGGVEIALEGAWSQG